MKMRLNIFLLLYFAVGIFTFGIANRDEPNCRLSKLMKDVSTSKRLVQPQTNGQWSRFTDGKYADVAMDHLTFWIKVADKNLKRYGITVKYTTLEPPGLRSKDDNKYMIIRPFGLEDCEQKQNRLSETTGSFPLQYCHCAFYERNNVAYLPIEVWTSAMTNHKVYFEQYSEILKIYLFEDEAEMYNTMPTCPNAGFLSKDPTIKLGRSSVDTYYDLTFVRDDKMDGDVDLGPFYLKDGKDYVNFNNYDIVMMLLIRDWAIKPYVLIELRDGKTLHQSVEFKIEVDGQAPDKNAAILINDGTGLKINFELKRCHQWYLYNGFVRFVIKVSESGLFRASFYDQADENLWIIIPYENFALYEGLAPAPRSNNHFTSYWIIYTPPGAVAPTIEPPPASVTDLLTPSNNQTNFPSKKESCDDGLLFLWLLIIVICIDVILVIILVLLIIFAHRGSKKMKAAMTKKKMKDPKAAVTPAKQDAATATSPMAITPSKKEAKENKMKPAEKEIKGKTNGGGKKSTDGKTTTFYTVDQTKYHTVDQTKFYTVDNTFDKSKKGKK